MFFIICFYVFVFDAMLWVVEPKTIFHIVRNKVTNRILYILQLLFTNVHICASYIFTVGCYHRDGRAEQTYSHLPGLPRNGAKPEQLATVWVDPTAGCTEGLDHITTLPQTHTVLVQKPLPDTGIKWSNLEAGHGCDIASRFWKWTNWRERNLLRNISREEKNVKQQKSWLHPDREGLIHWSLYRTAHYKSKMVQDFFFTLHYTTLECCSLCLKHSCITNYWKPYESGWADWSLKCQKPLHFIKLFSWVVFYPFHYCLFVLSNCMLSFLPIIITFYEFIHCYDDCTWLIVVYYINTHPSLALLY